MPLTVDSDPVSSPFRDAVQNVPSEVESPPAIVSISDTHGYLDDPRQALLTLRDYFVIESVVTVDSDDLPN